MKMVLVGAGSAQFGHGTLGDIFNSQILRGSEIVLLDINAKSLEGVLTAAREFIRNHGLDFSVSATTDRRAAFKGARFIISSIEVGNRFRLWDEDWKIPLQYGIHQVYGENGGPGGVFHSLRIVPPILEIVRDAMELCPDAWIFNYSNPMTAIVTTVKRAFPQANFVGLCHEIGWLSRWLPRMLGRNEKDLSFTAAGLNHFSCMIELTDAATGEDLYPEVRRRAGEFFLREPGYSDVYGDYLSTGTITGHEQFEKESVHRRSRFEWSDRKLVRFMLENYGLLPITTDSHFGEYLGWAWDVVDHRGILDFYDYYQAMLTQSVKPEIRLQTAERVVPIIDGILGGGDYREAAVNVLNDGLLEDLPSWVAVEVPASVVRGGVTGLKVPGLPKGYLALLRNYTGVYDLTAEAVLKGKKEYVIQALLANPVVHRVTDLRAMVDRMIDQQGRWLGYLK